jgi:hypothetical protein
MTVENILAVYDLATDTDVSEGRGWYPYCKVLCQVLSDEFDVEFGRIVSAIAAVSPLLEWERTYATVRALLEGRNPYSGAIRRNVDKAYHILFDDDWQGLLSGNKVVSFAQCILGNLDHVCVDTWAWRVWAGADTTEQPPNLSRRNRYETIRDDYRAAARKVGLEPAELQAVCWVAIRRAGAANNHKPQWGQLSLDL